MHEFEFTIANGEVTGESRVVGDATTSVHIPSDATFSIGTGTITETLTTAHGSAVLDFSQDASAPSIYDLVKTSWDPSQGSGDGSGHHPWSGGHGGAGGDGWSGGHGGSGGHGWSGDGWTGDGWTGASDPGGPLHPAGVSDPVSAHGPGPAEIPGLETHIAAMHASGGSLI